MLKPYREPAIVNHYGIERFDLDKNFVPVEEDREPGLYRYEMSGPRRMQFADEYGTRYHVDLAVGTWAEARRIRATDLLYWESRRHERHAIRPVDASAAGAPRASGDALQRSSAPAGTTTGTSYM